MNIVTPISWKYIKTSRNTKKKKEFKNIIKRQKLEVEHSGEIPGEY